MIIKQSKAESLAKLENGTGSDANDEWDINWEAFEKSLNSKTKCLVINSPHNPLGKIFTNEELARMAKILQKYPNVIVIEDSVYEGIHFDDMHKQPLPKMAFQENMRNRTIGCYSTGKIFCATGLRSGWVVGPQHLIHAVRAVHQFNVYCSYNVVETASQLSIEELNRTNNAYLHETAKKMENNRNTLIKKLATCPFDFDLWIPKGGYFAIADIGRCSVDEKYAIDDYGEKRTKNQTFSYQVCAEKRVVCIPTTTFYEDDEP